LGAQRFRAKRVNSTLAGTLQNALDTWQLFAPCLGANVTIDDSLYGIWHGASGYRDVGRTPMPRHAQSYIYSITKTFTAVRVVQLAQSAALSLDDPITEYLPGLPFPAGVTIRRLLNHSAGVPSYTGLAKYEPATRASPSAPWPYEHVRDLTCTGQLDFEPGCGWRYSNTGYMLLAKLIATVTGKSLGENIRSTIVEPLGLTNTYVAEAVDGGKLVPGYCRSLNDRSAIEDVTRKYHPWWCLTGLIASNTAEIAQFFRGLFSGKLVSSSSLDQMKQYVPVGEKSDGASFFRNPSYGLGLMIDPDFGHGGFYGHGGDGPGFNTWAMYLPDFQGRSIVLVAFCNTTMGGHPVNLVRDLMRVLGDAESRAA
jgi:D-alanyl-D-alanine carboxypeptidase